MKKYNITLLSENYDKNNKFDLSKDALLSNNTVLLPGRFYVLNYMSKTKEEFNSRPVILSLGISKTDPESFLCIDLCSLPIKVRYRFLEMYYEIFSRELEKNMEQFYFPRNADFQSEIKQFNYDNLKNMVQMIPIKMALKKYKIKNTLKIYSLLFNDIYKVAGKFCDENYYVNGDIRKIQNDFLMKMMKK